MLFKKFSSILPASHLAHSIRVQACGFCPGPAGGLVQRTACSRDALQTLGSEACVPAVDTGTQLKTACSSPWRWANHGIESSRSACCVARDMSHRRTAARVPGIPRWMHSWTQSCSQAIRIRRMGASLEAALMGIVVIRVRGERCSRERDWTRMSQLRPVASLVDRLEQVQRDDYLAIGGGGRRAKKNPAMGRCRRTAALPRIPTLLSRGFACPGSENRSRGWRPVRLRS